MKNTSYYCNLIVLTSIFFVQLSFAQTARKPSYYENKKQQVLSLPVYIDPKGSTPIKTKVSYLNNVLSQKQFDLLSRVYQTGTPFEIPHILFTIDRKNKNKIYFLNTPKHELHETFIQRLLNQRLPKYVINQNYEAVDRRFLFGTLSWQNHIKGFTYEFWEGDKLTPELLKIADKEVSSNFFAPVQFKTNSTWHEEVARNINLSFVTQESLIKEQSFMALNTGRASGRLVLVRTEADLDQVGENDIVILKDVPISLAPVAGVISEKPSTILSHVNLLTKGWGIPNIYLQDAEKILTPLLNQQVNLTVLSNNYEIELSSDNAKPNTVTTQPAKLPRPNLKDSRLKTLAQLHAKDSVVCGAKAANLGEIKNNLTETYVPDGFCIPFAQYHQFMQQNNLAALLKEIEALPDFQNSSSARKKALANLRQTITSWQVDPKIVQQWVQQWEKQLKGQGVFVRSSSNSEDLPNFSGAGLYTTIPNVKTAQDLEMAVKQSWASVFNYEAYEARRVAKISQDSVMMSTFVQTAINADASGVMITTDPFDSTHYHTTYIVAKRGIGIRVVEGKRLAEQIMYNHFSHAIQVLSRSDEQTALQLDENGGVREVPLNGKRVVLTDQLVVKLADAGLLIKMLFGNQEQDIEWAIKDGKVIILQARPFLQK